jgi:hypothetical protein
MPQWMQPLAFEAIAFSRLILSVVWESTGWNRLLGLRRRVMPVWDFGGVDGSLSRLRGGFALSRVFFS